MRVPLNHKNNTQTELSSKLRKRKSFSCVTNERAKEKRRVAESEETQQVEVEATLSSFVGGFAAQFESKRFRVTIASREDRNNRKTNFLIEKFSNIFFFCSFRVLINFDELM